jgi:hypothetical protein
VKKNCRNDGEKMSGMFVFLNCPLVWTEESKFSLASYIFSISKTQGIKLLTIFCDSESLAILDKVPRSIAVQCKPRPKSIKAFYMDVQEICSSPAPNVILPNASDILFLIPELTDFVVPEALQACAQAMKHCDYAFVREKSGTELLTRIKFIDIRHWMLGAEIQGVSTPFMTKLTVFVQDKDDFSFTSSDSLDILFDVLCVMKKRTLGTPLPSLSMIIDPKIPPPPVIPWKQIQDLVKNVLL